jgi:hypothetical protein
MSGLLRSGAPVRGLAVATLGLAAALSASACIRHDRRIQQHQEALQSLGSTTKAIADAWLTGRVSGTYTHTALEQTFRLVEQERTALASAPERLIDPRGARLSDAADQLSRLVAEMMSDVRAADAAGVRSHLAALPIDHEREKP